MLIFFAPFVFMIIPLVFVLVLVAGALGWVRSLRRPTEARRVKPDQPFIEGEFIDEESPDKPVDGSSPPRDPLEKRP